MCVLLCGATSHTWAISYQNFEKTVASLLLVKMKKTTTLFWNVRTTYPLIHRVVSQKNRCLSYIASNTQKLAKSCVFPQGSNYRCELWGTLS